jgi:ADP-ribose pyrophosphatase
MTPMPPPDRPAEAKTIAHRRVFTGRMLSLDVDEVEEPGGVRGVREVVRHPGSVAVLPVHEDGLLVLVRQYRYPVAALVWELPAGKLDGGESPEAGARREMEEEVGLKAGFLEPLSVFYTTPGFCDEVMHVFRATGLTAVPPRPEEDERIEVGSFTLEEARAMIARGEVREGKTLIALLLESERRTRDGFPPR